MTRVFANYDLYKIQNIICFVHASIGEVGIGPDVF